MNIGLLLKIVDDYVWGPGMLCLLMGTGIYLTFRLRFLPLRNLGFALRCAFDIHEGDKGIEAGANNRGVSSFSAFTTELATTIGTGNIVGVATAFILGGPGALVWMMLASVLGMATKLVESMLAVKYRSIKNGKYVGGPMYTLVNKFKGKKWALILATSFSLFAVFASLGMGNMTQINSISEALNVSFGIKRNLVGIIFSLLTLIVIVGGVTSISKITNFLVPFMGIFYIAGCALIIFSNIVLLPDAIGYIIKCAFSKTAVSGGILGNMMTSAYSAMRWGISRGCFSNEAGLGASGISAANARTDDYIKQGYISMSGVFVDTMVICFISGITLAVSGVVGIMDEQGRMLTGMALMTKAFESVFGNYGTYFISICVTMFAFATVIAWEYQGETAFEFVMGSAKYDYIFKIIYFIAVYMGAVVSLEYIWDFSDICNGLMAIPNLICVLLLSKEACDEIVDYNKNLS